MKIMNALGVLAAATLITGGVAQAKELRVSAATAPTQPSYDPVYTTFMDEVEKNSDGALTTRHLGLEVNSLRGSLENLKSGVLDIASVVILYHPAEFPNSNLVADLASLGSKGAVMTGAMTEYVMTCADCIAEFKREGIVFLGGSSSASYGINTSKPVASLADLEGLRLRSGGAPFTRWAEAMGAEPVQISQTDEFEAIANGLLDGSLHSGSNFKVGNLYELLPYYTPLGIGTFHGISSFTARLDTWDKLSVEERQQIAAASMTSIVTYAPHPLKVVQELAENGDLHIVDPNEGLMAALEAHKVNEVALVIEKGSEFYGIDDAEKKVNRFVDLVEKWRGIVEEIGEDDTAALTDRLNEEVITQIDFSTYGL